MSGKERKRRRKGQRGERIITSPTTAQPVSGGKFYFVNMLWSLMKLALEFGRTVGFAIWTSLI